MRYLFTPSLMKVSGDALKELGWREMEKVPAFPGLTDTSAEPRLYIPGGGITKGLYTDRYMHSIRDRRSEWLFENLLLNGGADIRFFVFFQLCRGYPAGCATTLLLRRRQHPWRVNACEPAQRLAPPAGQSCEWQAGVSQPALHRHMKSATLQFQTQWDSWVRITYGFFLFPLVLIYHLSFKYDGFQERAPFTFRLSLCFRLCSVVFYMKVPLTKPKISIYVV